MNTQETETALRLLESQGFDVKQLWRELSDKIAREERGTPTTDDARYVLPSVAPTLAEHFVDGRNPTLEAGKMWEGYSYTLSPGQRAVLRETYGLTPTATVTLGWVERWPGTSHPHSMMLKSDVHVDPRNRKHVLAQCVIRNVGEFLRVASEADSAEDGTARKSSLTRESLTEGRVVVLDSNDKWAVEDLTGVKLTKDCTIVIVAKATFHLQDSNGRTAKVPTEEFFTTAEEYAVMHATPKARKARGESSDRVLTSLDELIKSLL